MPAKHLAPKQPLAIVKIIKKPITELKMLSTIVKSNKGQLKRSLKLHNRLKAIQK
jgi:hypothetical protein